MQQRKFRTYCGKEYWVDEEKGIFFIEKGILYEIPLSEITKVKMWGTPTCVGIDIYCKFSPNSITITAADREDATDQENKRGKAELEEFLSSYWGKLPLE